MGTSCLCATTQLQNSHLRIWLLKDPGPLGPYHPSWTDNRVHWPADGLCRVTRIHQQNHLWPAAHDLSVQEPQDKTRIWSSRHSPPHFPAPCHGFHTIHLLFQEVGASVSFEKVNHVWRTRWVYLKRSLSEFPALPGLHLFLKDLWQKDISHILQRQRQRSGHVVT